MKIERGSVRVDPVVPAPSVESQTGVAVTTAVRAMVATGCSDFGGVFATLHSGGVGIIAIADAMLRVALDPEVGAGSAIDILKGIGMGFVSVEPNADEVSAMFGLLRRNGIHPACMRSAILIDRGSDMPDQRDACAMSFVTDKSDGIWCDGFGKVFLGGGNTPRGPASIDLSGLRIVPGGLESLIGRGEDVRVVRFPEGAVIDGHVQIANMDDLVGLPNGFRVTGSVTIANCGGFRSIGTGLEVAGDVNIWRCRRWDGIIPRDARIGGMIRTEGIPDMGLRLPKWREREAGQGDHDGVDYA
jgi:hypothetical protein